MKQILFILIGLSLISSCREEEVYVPVPTPVDLEIPTNFPDVEYNFDDMTDEQKILVNHVADLDRKVNSAQFNLDQLNVGKQAFIKMLKESLSGEDKD